MKPVLVKEEDVPFLEILTKNSEKKEEFGKENKHYIKNKELYAVFVEHTKNKKRCAEAGLPQPQLPDEISRSIILIANRMANKHVFNRYPFKEDMIGDGILECLTYVNGFDPEKSQNPFAYISQAIKNAFFKRLTKESKYQYAKLKLYDDGFLLHEIDSEHEDYIQTEHNDFYDNHLEKLDKLKTFLDSRKTQPQPKNVDNESELNIIDKFGMVEDKNDE